jgi:hypothetical protein
VPLQSFSQHVQLQFPLHITGGVQKVAAAAPPGVKRRTRWRHPPGVRFVHFNDLGTGVGAGNLRDPHCHVFPRQGVAGEDHAPPIAGHTVSTVRDVADNDSHQLTGLIRPPFHLSRAPRTITVFFAGYIVCDIGHNGSIDFLACSVHPCTS